MWTDRTSGLEFYPSLFLSFFFTDILFAPKTEGIPQECCLVWVFIIHRLHARMFQVILKVVL